MSACAGRVGSPVEGPPRCTLTKTHGRFRHGGVADVLHHEREAGAGGDGEGLGSAPDRALDGDGGGQFVLHLDEDAADGGDSSSEAFDHFRGGRNGITCGKSRTGCEGSLTAGVITVEKMDTRENAFRISVHVRRSEDGEVGAVHSAQVATASIFRRRPRGEDGIPWN